MGAKVKLFACFIVAAVVLALPALGDAIPHPNIGHAVPASVITATSTGPMIAYYFDGFSAAHNDLVAVMDVTAGWTSPWFFPNHATVQGTAFAVGSVASGDVLEFLIKDTFTGFTYSSNPANSPDNTDHFYVTPHTSVGPVGIPVGTYVGGEDLSASVSDFNYADDEFVYSIGSAASIPEPATLALVGLGLVAAGLFRRVRSKR
jgi:hypothetical protein